MDMNETEQRMLGYINDIIEHQRANLQKDVETGNTNRLECNTRIFDTLVDAKFSIINGRISEARNNIRSYTERSVMVLDILEYVVTHQLRTKTVKT